MRHSVFWLHSIALAMLLIGPYSNRVLATKPSCHYYDQMAPSYLATFPMDTTGDHRDEEEQKKKKQFEIPQLSSRELSVIGLNILKQDEQRYGTMPLNNIVTPEVWKNLEIFANPHQKPEKTVLGSIAYTRTTLGRLTLAKILANPTTDIVVLQQRQRMIRRLLDDEELFNKLDKLLQLIAKHESSLLSLTRTEDPLLQKNIEMYWYSGNLFAKNSHGMASYKALQDWVLILEVLFMSAGALGWATRLALDKPLRTAAVRKFNNAMGGDKAFAAKAIIYSSPLLLAGLATVLILTSKSRIQSFKYIRQRMRSGHLLIKTLKKLEKLLDCHDFAPLHKSLLSNLEQSDDHRNKLVKMLENKAFMSNSYLFTTGGDVLASLPVLKEKVSSLFHGIHLIGELDAYISLAKLYRAQEKAGMPYCFASYRTQAKPYIHARDFWHPSLPHDKAVKNTLILGTPGQHRNLVITGVNAGGKSTSMKALACSVMFAQTIGIVPAHQFILTPFARINTYLNITDDLSADRSLFKAELYRALTLLYDIKNLGPGEFCFTLLDEILTGTERVEGEAAAYGIARSIAESSQCITVLATHFPGLTKLEHDTKTPTHPQGVYKNMKVVVNIDSNGDFSYPYKLYPGITDQQIALDILDKEGFASSITTKARDVLNNPENYSPTDADV